MTADRKPIHLKYTNWRGETSIRHIRPGKVYFGETEWHPEPCWLLECYDVEKDALRVYALADCDFTVRTGGDT